MELITPKGLRIIKGLQNYCKVRPGNFDTQRILSKVKISSAGNGEMTASFTVEPNMCNLMDSLHGGFSATVADTIGMLASMTVPDGRISWTTNMNVLFLNKAVVGDKIIVKASPIKLGSISLVETVLKNQSTGKTILKATMCYQRSSEEYQQTGGELLLLTDQFDETQKINAVKDCKL